MKIFSEIIPHARSLITDVFGNYVIQKVCWFALFTVLKKHLQYIYDQGFWSMCSFLSMALKGKGKSWLVNLLVMFCLWVYKYMVAELSKRFISRLYCGLLVYYLSFLDFVFIWKGQADALLQCSFGSDMFYFKKSQYLISYMEIWPS